MNSQCLTRIQSKPDIRTGILICSGFDNRLIKFHNEMVAKILRYSTIIVTSSSVDTILFFIKSYTPTVLVSINNDILLFFRRISYLKHSATRCSGQGCSNTIIKLHPIAIRCCLFILVPETHATGFIICNQLAKYRHNGESAIIINPRTRLMSLAEPSDQTVSVHIHPTASVFSGLWTPEVHSPRHSHCRICVTMRELKGRRRSY